MDIEKRERFMRQVNLELLKNNIWSEDKIVSRQKKMANIANGI